MASSSLPWLWVIEALASFKQVDASILKELVKKVPEISGDLGKDAREMVNFRILETIASQQVGNNRSVSPASISEKSFGPLDRSEDVVRHILRERTDDLEMFKPQVQSFVTQKRAVMPKCTLLKLKDAILEGKHPIFKSLKAKSGLLTSSEANARTVMNEATCPSDGNNLTSLNTEDMNDFSPANCQNRNLTPSKRVLNNLESEDQGLRSHNDSPCFDHEGDSNLPISKKLKHVRDEAPKTLVSLNLPVNEAKDVGNHCSDVEISNSAPPNQARRNTSDQTNTIVEKSQPTPSKIMSHDKSHPKNIPLKSRRATNHNLEKKCSSVSLNSPVDEVKDVGNRCSDMETSNSAPPNQDRRNTNDQINTIVEKFQPTPSIVMSQDKSHTKNIPLKSKCATDHNLEKECSSDSDGFQEERVNIAVRKLEFLSSQCTFTEDSISFDDFTELDICVKCEKSGDLLVCSVNACPIVVHQSCLGTSPSFDSNGKFFCPYCSYSRAITNYLKIKKKTALLRKDLAAFMGSDNGHRPRKIAEKTARLEKSQVRKEGNVIINDQTHHKHVRLAIAKVGETSDSNKGNLQ